MVLQQIVTAVQKKLIIGIVCALLGLLLIGVVAATLGYPEGVKVAKYAQEHNLAVADAVLEMGIMTKEEADMLLDPALLVNPEKMAEVIARWKGEKQKQ